MTRPRSSPSRRSPTREPGPGQALVRVLLSPIHNHDLWTVRGSYGLQTKMPARAGTEAVGVVEALGEGVQGLTVGQRVASGGSVQHLGRAHRRARGRPGAHLPDAIDDEAAAQLNRCRSAPSRCSTSSRSPRVTGSSRTPPTVPSAASWPSSAAARGVHVLGLVRRAAGVEGAARAGRLERVVATDDDGWRDRVGEIVGAGPIVAGVDPVGGRAAGDVVSLLADDGVLVVFGAMASPTLEIGSGDVIFKQTVIKGFWGSKVLRRHSRARSGGALMGKLVARHQLPARSPCRSRRSTPSTRSPRRHGRTRAFPGRRGKILLRP